MENENRIVELLAEMLIRQDSMVDELRNVKTEVAGVREQVKETNQRLDQAIERLDRFDKKTEHQFVTLNVQTVDNTRAIFKLAENVEQIADLHDRVWKLEKAVYK